MTEELFIEDFVNWLEPNFPRLEFEIKLQLKKLFPKPGQKDLRYFWSTQGAHADISVFRHGQLVCIIEPGGWQHLTDKQQKANDKRKELICKENNVNFLPLLNSCLDYRDTRQFKRMLKCYFYQE